MSMLEKAPGFEEPVAVRAVLHRKALPRKASRSNGTGMELSAKMSRWLQRRRRLYCLMDRPDEVPWSCVTLLCNPVSSRHQP